MHFLVSLIISLGCAVNITSEQEKVFTLNVLRYFEDHQRGVTFDDFYSKRDSLLSYNPDYRPSMYNPTSAYWVELEFCIEKEETPFLLEFYDQTIDSISLFVSINDSSFMQHQFGSQFGFNDKSFQHKNFEVYLGGEGHYVIYARIVNRNYADVRIAVRTINRFINYALNEYYLYGLFYGMILIISLYNVSIYSAIGEIKYLYYTFYILSVGLFAMCVDGIAYQYLWPNMARWNNIAHGVALFSVIFWSILFSKKFLGLKLRTPRINLILNLILVARSLIFIYALLIDHSIFYYRNIEIIPLSTIFIGSIYAFRMGYKPARFFIVAYGFLFLGFLLKAMLMLSILPFEAISDSPTLQILSYYSLYICFLLEMLFLSIALSDRVRILKDNRDRVLKRAIIQHEENAKLKDKVNRELEEKIKERTKQLEMKNRQLTDSNNMLLLQTKEINKLNSKLDLDNWKLKNNIKEVLQNRLINKSLTPEQFESIFPNPTSCYQFLENLKWGEGYHCIKCNNFKYSVGQTKFARRCTKCGYDESITSNTVFHRIRFPIEKAFYILYLVNSSNEHYTLDELSELLHLRRNTVWSFKKKVMEVYQSEESKVIINNLFSDFEKNEVETIR